MRGTRDHDAQSASRWGQRLRCLCWPRHRQSRRRPVAGQSSWPSRARTRRSRCASGSRPRPGATGTATTRVTASFFSARRSGRRQGAIRYMDRRKAMGSRPGVRHERGPSERLEVELNTIAGLPMVTGLTGSSATPSARRGRPTIRRTRGRDRAAARAHRCRCRRRSSRAQRSGAPSSARWRRARLPCTRSSGSVGSRRRMSAGTRPSDVSAASPRRRSASGPATEGSKASTRGGVG